jgi:hypothetical protein
MNSAAGLVDATVLGISFLVDPDRDRIFRAHVPDNSLPGYSSATARVTMSRSVTTPHSRSNRELASPGMGAEQAPQSSPVRRSSRGAG